MTLKAIVSWIKENKKLVLSRIVIDGIVLVAHLWPDDRTLTQRLAGFGIYLLICYGFVPYIVWAIIYRDELWCAIKRGFYYTIGFLYWLMNLGAKTVRVQFHIVWTDKNTGEIVQEETRYMELKGWYNPWF